MRDRGRTGLETLVAVILIAILLTVVSVRYRNAKRAAFNTQMWAETRDLIAAQEAFYATASMTRSGPRYAGSLEELAFVPHKTVSIELRGGVRGWAALVTSLELPAEYFCSIYVGDGEPYGSGLEEGVMACEP